MGPHIWYPKVWGVKFGSQPNLGFQFWDPKVWAQVWFPYLWFQIWVPTQLGGQFGDLYFGISTRGSKYYSSRPRWALVLVQPALDHRQHARYGREGPALRVFQALSSKSCPPQTFQGSLQTKITCIPPEGEPNRGSERRRICRYLRKGGCRSLILEVYE